MNKFISFLLSNNFSRNIRNHINFKPSIIYKPSNSKAPVSDFFYWENSDIFETKFILTNLATHALPNLKMHDEVIIYIYDMNGIIVNKITEHLDFNQTKEIFFSDLDIYGFGSFLVFHNFENYDEFNKRSSHIADRGYTGYRRNKGIWNYMHGNNYACSFENDNKIKSLMATTIFKNSYEPQVSFNDTSNFSIILNNPTGRMQNLKIKSFDYESIIKNTKTVNIDSFNTRKIDFNNETIETIRIESNFIFCRPVIIKEYESYFDIFHS